MISHEEAQELLGAYALDAVEEDEAALVEYHLDRCPRCRDELRNHREVVGLLAYAGHEAPAGLWDRVVEGIREAGSSAPAPALRSVAARPGSRILPLRSRRVLAIVGAAAVVAIALLGVEVTRLQHRTDQLSSQVASVTTSPQPTMAAVRQALAEPGAKRVNLRSPAGGPAQLDAVILPSGAGYVYSPQLLPLPRVRDLPAVGSGGAAAGLLRSPRK